MGGDRSELSGLPSRGRGRTGLMVHRQPDKEVSSCCLAEENILLSIPQPVGFIGLKKPLA